MEIFGRKRVDGRGVIDPYVAIKARFENLAWRMYGFRNGKLTELAAHASIGKTAFMMTGLYRLMIKNIPVATVRSRTARIMEAGV